MTLITRPRRFGKTLNLSMMECFFSNLYANRADLFSDLSITKDTNSLKLLSEILYHIYNQKVIILLDEYDTPMQEAYVGGYWADIAFFFGSYSMLPLRQIHIWREL